MEMRKEKKGKGAEGKRKKVGLRLKHNLLDCVFV